MPTVPTVATVALHDAFQGRLLDMVHALKFLQDLFGATVWISQAVYRSQFWPGGRLLFQFVQAYSPPNSSNRP